MTYLCTYQSTVIDSYTKTLVCLFVFSYALSWHRLHSLQLVQKAETGEGEKLGAILAGGECLLWTQPPVAGELGLLGGHTELLHWFSGHTAWNVSLLHPY